MKVIFSLILLLFASTGVAEEDEEYEDDFFKIYSEGNSEIGAYSIYNQDIGVSNVVGYYQDHLKIKLDDEYDTWSLYLRYRLRGDFADKDPQNFGEHNLKKELLYLAKPVGSGNLNIGIQEINWGESVIFPILDIVNSKDFTYAKGPLDPDSKLANLMINYEYLSDLGKLQLLYLPISRTLILPEEIGDFTLDMGDDPEFFKDHEFGFRYQIPSDFVGISFYYFNHYNREPSITFSPFSGEDDLILNRDRLYTLGLSANVATLTRVYKGDFRYTPNQPISGVVQRKESRDLIQSMFGVNQAIGLNHTLSLELHYDNWGRMPQSYNDDAFALDDDEQDGNLLWAGASLNSSFQNGLISPQLIVFRGVNNEDQFAQAKSDFIINENYIFGLEYQYSLVRSSSPKFVLSRAKRILFNFKWLL